MTIGEAIGGFRRRHHPVLDDAELIRHLSVLDGRIKLEIIDTHEGGRDVSFDGYTDKTPRDTELLVPFPYDDLYIKWLEAQSYYASSDTERYNDALYVFSEAYGGYAKYYNRTHMPISGSVRYS